MKSIDVVSIPVSNQEISMRFYQMLGFIVLEDSPMGGGKKWIRMGLEGSPTTITLVNWFAKMPPGSVQGLVLRTDDLDSELRNLHDNGISTSKVEQAAHGKFLSFRDPDGNGLSFHQR
jgi:catechol 2,3-dioxygenase-like lactoylglutathione lyase family enzyme